MAVAKKVAAKKATAAPVAAKKEVKFVPPKNLAVCADMLYTLRQERLAKDKEAAALKSKETACAEYLINNLPKSQASGIAGKLARATVEMKRKAQVGNWDLLYEYIAKNQKKNPGVWSLIQRRLGEAAVMEMWEAKVAVPGVESIQVPTISLNKL